jgi:O-antigen/teichoic acid export membrane protein
MILIKNSIKWTITDLLEIPAKLIIFTLLVNLTSKYEFGIIAIGMLIFSYQSIFQVGSVDWNNFRLPKLNAQGINLRTAISETSTFTAINQIILLPLIILFIYYTNENKSWFLLIVLGSFSIQCIFYNFFLHTRMSLRFNHYFDENMKVQTIFLIIKLVVETITLFFFGVIAYLVVVPFTFLIPVIISKKIIRIDYFNKNFKQSFKKIIKNGFPFFGVMLVSLLIANLDRWFILKKGSLIDFANYSFIIYFLTVLMIIPGKFLSIIIQYLKELNSLSIPQNFKSEISISIFLLLVSLFTIILIIFFGIFEYILFFFPNYTNTEIYIKFIIILAWFKFSVAISTSILYVLNGKKIVFQNQIIILILYILMLSFAYFNLESIYNVILISTIATFVQLILNFYKILKILKIKISQFYFLLISLIVMTFITVLLSVLFIKLNLLMLLISIILMVIPFKIKNYRDRLLYFFRRTYKK